MLYDQQIISAQRKLGIQFPKEYIEFIKSGYDLGDSTLEPLQINSEKPYLDLVTHCIKAWEIKKIDHSLIPIVYDNGDYYCVNADGGVEFWSHDSNEITEKWPTIIKWASAMKSEV